MYFWHMLRQQEPTKINIKSSREER
jgi:hypothetical protein